MHQPIKPSLRYALSLIAWHLLTAIVVCATALPLSITLAALLLTSLSLFYYLTRDVLLLWPGSWREISLNQNEVSIITREGSSLLGKATPLTFVSTYFVVLCVELEGQRVLTSRVIFPDALSAGVFREFCVRLKFS